MYVVGFAETVVELLKVNVDVSYLVLNGGGWVCFVCFSLVGWLTGVRFVWFICYICLSGDTS